MIRFIQLLVLAAMVLAGAWYVLRALRPAPEDPDQRLKTTRIERAELAREVRIVGAVAPVLLTQVKSEIGGRVIAVRIDNGQTVKKGDLLVELDRKELESGVEEVQREMVSSRLQVDKARRDHDRVNALREKDFSTEQELLDARTELALRENALSIQEAELATLVEKLSKTRILAPHDGVVLNLDVTPGQVLVGANSFSQGDVPMEVADLSRLRIEAKVNEVDLAVIKIGQSAKVTFASIPGLEATAAISNISPSAEKNNQRQQWGQPENVLFPVRLDFAATDPRVKPGISALARIVAERADNAVIAPVSAIFREEEGSFVFCRRGGKWEKMRVQTGLNSSDKIQILNGLASGDEVALGLPKEFDPRYQLGGKP
jgi:HlyD family secretion protein